jgi:hypothetical protein
MALLRRVLNYQVSVGALIEVRCGWRSHICVLAWCGRSFTPSRFSRFRRD